VQEAEGLSSSVAVVLLNCSSTDIPTWREVDEWGVHAALLRSRDIGSEEHCHRMQGRITSSN